MVPMTLAMLVCALLHTNPQNLRYHCQPSIMLQLRQTSNAKSTKQQKTQFTSQRRLSKSPAGKPKLTMMEKFGMVVYMMNKSIRFMNHVKAIEVLFKFLASGGNAMMYMCAFGQRFPCIGYYRLLLS